MLQKRLIICISSRNICFCTIGYVLFATYESREQVLDQVQKRMDGRLKKIISYDVYGESWEKPLLIMIEHNQLDDINFIQQSLF